MSYNTQYPLPFVDYPLASSPLCVVILRLTGANSDLAFSRIVRGFELAGRVPVRGRNVTPCG